MTLLIQQLVDVCVSEFQILVGPWHDPRITIIITHKQREKQLLCIKTEGVLCCWVDDCWIWLVFQGHQQYNVK